MFDSSTLHMVSVCKECSYIRGMKMPVSQAVGNCDGCGKKLLVGEFKTTELLSPADAFTEKGYFNSKDLAGMLAILKNRKATLAARIMMLKLGVSRPMQESKVNDAIPTLDLLISEGLEKKAVNTCQKVFGRLKEVVEGLKINSGLRATQVVIYQNLNAELAGIVEKEKELSILYKNALDQILIDELRFRMGHEQFNKACDRSKEIYRERNKVK